MNRKQKICLMIGMVVFALELLFPPWIIPVGNTKTVSPINEGYRFLFSHDEEKPYLSCDTPRWIIPMCGTVLLTLGGVALLGDKKSA